MSAKEEAVAALVSHGTQLNGYTLSVALADPQQARKRGREDAA